MKAVGKEGTILVSKTILGQTTQKEEKIEIRPFLTDTASMSMSLGRTKNIGNYENVKVSVMVTAPCYKEEMIQVFKQVEALTKKLINEQLEKLED